MRVLLGLAGAVVVLGIYSSVLRTLVIPRPSRSGFTVVVQRLVHRPFQWLADRFPDAGAKDRLLAPAAPLAIVVTLIAWLGCLLAGYALLEAAVSGLGTRAALVEAGSSLFTLGFASGNRVTLNAIDFLAAGSGPIVIGLQIGYLPALYAAYQSRETEVTLLDVRAGSPPWGPEILARYAQVDLVDSLGELYSTWERWSAAVSESHTTYPVLVLFRSPRASRNWLVALLAVMDSAALHLAFNPSRSRAESRMALRAGFLCLRDIADTRGIPYERDPEPGGTLALTWEEFLDGVARMREQGYPMERSAQDAWPHFRGWRVNYEALVHRLARDLDAVPAPWSGPRRTAVATTAPRTPVDRRPAG